MTLSGSVPSSIGSLLPGHVPAMLHGRPREQVVHWAVHPGGRSVLDAVERALELDRGRSRVRARCCAATATCPRRPSSSCSRPCSRAAFPGAAALAFGPGLAIESMLFEVLG